MDAAKRIQLIRIIEKTQKNPEFSQKLGIQDKSVWKHNDPDPDSTNRIQLIRILTRQMNESKL